MRKNVNLENWRLAWVENAVLRQNKLDFKTVSDYTFVVHQLADFLFVICHDFIDIEIIISFPKAISFV